MRHESTRVQADAAIELRASSLLYIPPSGTLGTQRPLREDRIFAKDESK